MDLPEPGIKLRSPALQVDFLPTELSGKPTQIKIYSIIIKNSSLCLGSQFFSWSNSHLHGLALLVFELYVRNHDVCTLCLDSLAYCNILRFILTLWFSFYCCVLCFIVSIQISHSFIFLVFRDILNVFSFCY